MEKAVDYIAVAVAFFCHDGKGNLLMNKRSKKSRDEHDTWDQGGGSIKPGESIEKALAREIKEEYCTDIIKSEPLGFREVFRTDHANRRTHWIMFDFKVLVDKEQVKNGVPDKHSEIKWFKFDDLPTPLHSQFPVFLKKYKEKLF